MYLLGDPWDLTNRMWFSVVCTLIDNDIILSSQWSKCGGLMRRTQQILTTVMANIVVDKSADNAKPHSICFLPQYQRQRKFYNNCQNFRVLTDASSVV